MSSTGKALLALAVLVLTNLLTFGYATWRCRQEDEGQKRLLGASTEQQDQLRTENAELKQRVERLRVWGELIELQQDVNGVHSAINQLNFGTAIQGIERLGRRIELGEYGTLMQQHRPELLPLLDRAKQALRTTDAGGARNALFEVDQQSFRLVAASAMPGDFPGPPPAPQPVATPPPLAEATPALEATPTPAPTPTPTPTPAATAAGKKPKPTPTPKGGGGPQELSP